MPVGDAGATSMNVIRCLYLGPLRFVHERSALCTGVLYDHVQEIFTQQMWFALDNSRHENISSVYRVTGIGGTQLTPSETLWLVLDEYDGDTIYGYLHRRADANLLRHTLETILTVYLLHSRVEALTPFRQKSDHHFAQYHQRHA